MLNKEELSYIKTLLTIEDDEWRDHTESALDTGECRHDDTEKDLRRSCLEKVRNM